LIEPKPKEPTKHQYEYDAASTIAFLRQYKLEKDFKLNIEPNHTTLAGHSYEHDIVLASELKMLGSIDANTGDSSLGWDTDQFPMDVTKAVHVMRAVLKLNGLHAGGLNFDAKLRRESTSIEDLFVAHIGAMDTFAKALRIAVAMASEPPFNSVITERYSSWTPTHGSTVITKLVEGKITTEELNGFTKSEPILVSGGQEKIETMFNVFVAKF
jgi:xylose isomerase